MYIDATSVAGADRRFENEVVRLIRTALHPVESRLERIRVQVRSSGAGHVCRLHATAERGQMVVVESSAPARLGAIEAAADSLRQTIESRTARGVVGAVPRARSSGAPDSSPRSQAGLAPESEATMPVKREGAVCRPRVLLALHELDAANVCVLWARLLADALRADLDVCRVLPEAPAKDGLPAGKAWLDATRAQLGASREMRRWCAEVLPDAELAEPIVAGGDMERAVAMLVRERGVEWIVMAERGDGGGRSATALALASRCPVLVARAPTSRSTLLVASDVSEDLYPISSRAAALAEALHAPVLAFHDVGFRVPELSSRVNALTEAWAEIQTERLEASGHQRLPELEVLLGHGTDRVETILVQARREDAEIIVIGVSQDAASADNDLAARVVDRAVRSVLVVPSNVSRNPQRQRSPEHDAEAERSSRSDVPERRSSPRVGFRTAHSDESARRSRSG